MCVCVCVCVCVSHLVVSNSVTPWTVAHQAPLSMEFSRQENRSGLPFPPQGDLGRQLLLLIFLRDPLEKLIWSCYREPLGYLSMRYFSLLCISLLCFSILSCFYHHTASPCYILSRKFSENMKFCPHFFFSKLHCAFRTVTFALLINPKQVLIVINELHII